MPTNTNRNNNEGVEVTKKALDSAPQQIIQPNQIIKLLKSRSRQKQAEKAFYICIFRYREANGIRFY
ncbi:hypothetical protein [Legionella parisiensis]|nr:hypothetical protein [Legionella parisiensis]